MFSAALLTVALAAAPAAESTPSDDPTANPTYLHPVIKGHGGIIPLPDAALQPRKNAKVLIDITSDEKSGSVLKGFDRAALILNLYAHAGVGPKEGMKMAIILHGPAVTAALSDEATAARAKPYLKDKGVLTNPNLDLMRQLKKAGVEILVCGQNLSHLGIATTEVADAVTVAVSAATVNIGLQADGYSVIGFH
ncbi:DsrE family protein [Alienimonas californiensis]|uniref:DsrE/DsrF-like family protein n=1 Tax=Alienimonas californiensis TaxID=2527989 RepID=A0A517PBC8_9PLAN|nr:DsrE family protein [Alienimonas californiensis]QDT16678.1 DsrE/DsrF-like family protein [Alienimonas californiensis]